MALSQSTLWLVRLEYAELAGNHLRKECCIRSVLVGRYLRSFVRHYHRVIFKETDS